MSKYASGISLKLLIGIAGVLLLSACNGGSNPEGTQTQIEPPAQAPQITPEVIWPTATSPVLPTGTEAAYPGSQSQEGYPYPVPGEGDPSPEIQDPEPEPPTPGYPSPDDGFAVTVPALKIGLEATDPSRVSLASGDLQLVEFFAFW